MPGQEKTEKATPKKRRDSRMKEGNVLQSKEINTAASVLGVFLALSVLGPFMYSQLLAAVNFFLSSVGDDKEVTNEFFTQNAFNIIRFAVIIIAPLLLIAMLLGTIPTVIQTKGLFTMKPLKPKFSKLNPITGMKRLFSLQSLVNIVKGLLIIGIIVTIVYFRVSGLLPQIRMLTRMTPGQGVAFIASNIFSTVLIIVIVFAFISVLDYIYQWWQFEKKLKMSKQEVKDEYKQIEGDPQIKNKIRQKQREVAMNRMMQEVPGSDVVVRNPTHYAVALRYDPDTPLNAPRVVAKGQDALAMKIIAIAEEHGIVLIEERELAKKLHDTVKTGSEIPHIFYNAVATIFAELESIKEKLDM